jgi:hypothetical protein
MSTIPDRNDVKEYAKYIAEVMLAYANGSELQYNSRGNGWNDCGAGRLSFDWFSGVYRVKPEPPKPTFVPWTFKTCPEGAIKVQNKETEEFGQLYFCTNGALFDTDLDSAVERYTFPQLLERFNRLNGQPCGTEVKP